MVSFEKNMFLKLIDFLPLVLVLVLDEVRVKESELQLDFE